MYEFTLYHIHIYTNLYIYIEEPRRRFLDFNVPNFHLYYIYVNIYIYTHIYIYVYIYIYIYTHLYIYTDQPRRRFLDFYFEDAFFFNENSLKVEANKGTYLQT
jgi:hypothetical protein